MHTHVWEHRPGTPMPTIEQLEHYCEVAAQSGVRQLAITEHCHRFTRIADEVLPHWDRPGAAALQHAADRVLAAEGGGDLDAYVSALEAAKERGLPVLVSMEVDHLPGTEEAMSAVLDEYPLDMVLGSVHWLGAWLFDDYGNPVFANEWETRSVDEAWSAYVDAVVELARSGRVDVLAHVDLIKVAGHRPADVAPHEQRLVEGIAGTGVAVEISTAGWRKPVGELYPSPSLLAGLHAAGVPFTTAADAHAADLIGDRFDDLRLLLDAHGIDQLVTFDQREPTRYPLT